MRRAPTYLEPQYVELSVSTRTTPVEFGACTKLSVPIAMATCDAPSPFFLVLKKIRSPGLMSAGRIVSPTSYCCSTIRGTEMPYCAKTYCTRPLQSNPPGSAPPSRYGTPRNPSANCAIARPSNRRAVRSGALGAIGALGALGAMGASGAGSAPVAPAATVTAPGNGRGIAPVVAQAEDSVKAAIRMRRMRTFCIIGPTGPEVQS